MRCELADHFRVPSLISDVNRNGFVVNYFRASHSDARFLKLGEGGRRVLDTPNAGGKGAQCSEALSFEVLEMLFNAQLLFCEMQIEYWPMGGKITDYSVNISGLTIGVSVTRALKFKGEFSDEDATYLLTKKLYGVNESSRLVIEAQRWSKQLLHIWAENQKVADVLRRVWTSMDPKLTSNTFVLVTVTEDNSRFIFA